MHGCCSRLPNDKRGCSLTLLIQSATSLHHLNDSSRCTTRKSGQCESRTCGILGIVCSLICRKIFRHCKSYRCWSIYEDKVMLRIDSQQPQGITLRFYVLWQIISPHIILDHPS